MATTTSDTQGIEATTEPQGRIALPMGEERQQRHDQRKGLSESIATLKAQRSMEKDYRKWVSHLVRPFFAIFFGILSITTLLGGYLSDTILLGIVIKAGLGGLGALTAVVTATRPKR